MESSPIYQEGKRANSAGLGYGANPYDPDIEPAKYEEWMNGWGS